MLCLCLLAPRKVSTVRASQERKAAEKTARSKSHALTITSLFARRKAAPAGGGVKPRAV